MMGRPPRGQQRGRPKDDPRLGILPPLLLHMAAKQGARWGVLPPLLLHMGGKMKKEFFIMASKIKKMVFFIRYGIYVFLNASKGLPRKSRIVLDSRNQERFLIA